MMTTEYKCSNKCISTEPVSFYLPSAPQQPRNNEHEEPRYDQEEDFKNKRESELLHMMHCPQYTRKLHPRPRPSRCAMTPAVSSYTVVRAAAEL